MGKFFKSIYKVGMATVGVAAMFEPTCAVIAAASVVASATSSAIKDKNIKPVMKIINVLACNIDCAANSRVRNK